MEGNDVSKMITQAIPNFAPPSLTRHQLRLGEKGRVLKLYKFLDPVNYEASSHPTLPWFGYRNQINVSLLLMLD